MKLQKSERTRAPGGKGTLKVKLRRLRTSVSAASAQDHVTIFQTIEPPPPPPPTCGWGSLVHN